MRRGISLVEVCVMSAIGLALLVPLISLSTDNLTTPDDIADRELIEGVCLDTIERLKGVALDRPLPGMKGGPKPAAMLGPVELDPARNTLFDRVYLDRLDALHATVVPTIDRTADPKNPNLFKLDCKINWRDRRGKARVTREVRWCYAPLLDPGEPQ